MSTVFKTRKQRFAWIMLLIITVNIFSPATSYALTSGPTQPELQGFQPAGITDMVDVFSGDFSYNIPLFELPGPNGGYPFNLSYQSGVTLDQEASWVGLGWSLNPGAINRQMRGLPDEFKGDKIKTKMSIDKTVTVGYGFGGGGELFGAGNDVANLGLSVFYNNYRGFGYSVDASAGFTASVKSGMTNGVNLGVSVSLNSQEGASINPSISLGTKMGDFGLSAGYNSRSGLDRVSLDMQNRATFTGHKKGEKNGPQTTIGQSSASLYTASTGYTPQVSVPMRNLSISAKFNTGGAGWGVFGKAYVKGFYTEQWLKDDNQSISSPAYGYLYQDIGKGDAKSVLDFNREKDGMVSNESPNLGIPSMTYDIYSVTGQGIGSMYRPIRNDVGVIRDVEVVSETAGGQVGVDAAPALSHAGVNLSVNLSQSKSGEWIDDNDMRDRVGFQSQQNDDPFEPWNFKTHGELTGEKASILNEFGGTNAVRVRLSDDGAGVSATTWLENKTWSKDVSEKTALDRSRKQRNEVIQPYTNEQIANGSQQMIPYFNNKFFTRSATVTVTSGGDSTVRRDQPALKHHIAGFTALNADGMQYNYTIPVYNNVQEEVLFSATKGSGGATTTKVRNDPGATNEPAFKVNGTEKYLKKVALPPYAHSYLLTSILGQDYVDRKGDGVTADDLGYWVKFTYKKWTSGGTPYQWRDPLYLSHFVQGWRTDVRDDKGSYTYGEKELWYLVKAETKSHIVLFDLRDRLDGRGVTNRLANVPDTFGKAPQLLNAMTLYSRDTGIAYPIKTVTFGYNYELCPSTPNSIGPETGKLTLKTVAFKYGKGTQHLSPYEFTYPAAQVNPVDTTANPKYDQHAYDRWGVYKRYLGASGTGDPMTNIDFPYSEQNPKLKNLINASAAAWSLKEIKTPSGSKIIIDYESDDYGYVQHKPAMEMAYITNNGEATDRFTLPANGRVRFKLQQDVPAATPVPQHDGIVRSYLDMERKQLYFKARINLLATGQNVDEDISGYVDIDDTQTMILEKEGGTGDYKYGVFRLKTGRAKDASGNPQNIHPFTIRAWQHLRTNQPDKAKDTKQLTQTLDATNDTGTRIKKIYDLTEFWKDIKGLFAEFNNKCNINGWGKEVIASKSWIRVNSIDKIKYGGGSRVAQITLKDNWASDDEGVYGQVYDYTTTENGLTISSGVASYEPLIGGEENVLRYAKQYTQSVPLRSDNNLYFEFPINESYYPAPQVGYRKVTVTSLAAAALAGRKLKNVDRFTFPRKSTVSGELITYGTTGKTVHEFYTAKDFPVITDETEKADIASTMSIPVPFLGHVSASKLASSQGYSIVTNDMHGKPRQVSTYRQDPTGGWETDPISWVRYNYASDPKVYQGESVLSLKSAFVRNTDDDGTLSIYDPSNPAQSGLEQYTMGQENEFFMDMRQYEDNAWEGGVNLNADIVILPFLPAVIPIPTIWPSVGKSSSQLRTAVSNKIIFRPGILQSMEAYDGGSLVKTDNVKWDRLTGRVVLSTVNNNFDNLVYSYNIPAYKKYEGTGGAYQNVGLKFKIGVVFTPTAGSSDSYFLTPVGSPLLYPGDEIMLYNQSNVPVTKVIYTGDRGSFKKIFCPTSVGTSGPYTGLIVRSGYRNILTASAGSITALSDPTVKGTNATYSKTVIVPSNP